MQPKNATERRKRILTFAGLYAASVILMFFIFSAFGVHLSAGDQKATVQVNDRQVATSNDMLQADSLLHEKLRELQQSDDVYTLLLADSASQSQKNDAAGSAGAYELAFKKAIDSIGQVTTAYTGDKAAMYKTMLNSFASILNSREALKNIQSSMAAGKTTLSSSQQDMLQWKNQLSQKDNELARLNAEIKTLQGRGAAPSKPGDADEAQKGEIELLKTAFDDQQKEYNDFKDKYNRLKTENSSLASQVIEYKKAASARNENVNNAAENKINTLEQKVQDLNADLYFAKIDCNLSRADAQQIISNARQRKELLSESLAMLNSLSASADAGIQKKAKEKIVRLNHIAINLHE
jgi:chromosome segregation ATPase